MALMVVSCAKEIEYDESLLSSGGGKWQLTAENGKDKLARGEYWVYRSNGTGYTWVEEDDISEDEAQEFTWELDSDQLMQLHFGGATPKTYTVTTLTASTMKYYDNVDTSVKREFAKR